MTDEATLLAQLELKTAKIFVRIANFFDIL